MTECERCHAVFVVLPADEPTRWCHHCAQEQLALIADLVSDDEGDIADRVRAALRKHGYDSSIDKTWARLGKHASNSDLLHEAVGRVVDALKRAQAERDEYKRLADERLTLWQDARRAWCPNCGFVRDDEEWQCAKCGDRVFDSGEHHRDFERARRAETERDDARKQLDKLKDDLRVNLDSVYELTATLNDMQADRSELVRRYNLARELCDDLRGYTRDWDWKYGASWDAEYAAAFPSPAHCWQDEQAYLATRYGFGSPEHLVTYAEGYVGGTCMLDAGHTGDHVFTRDDQIGVTFAEEKKPQ